MAAFEVPVTECELYTVVSAFDMALRGQVIQARRTARTVPRWTVIAFPHVFRPVDVVFCGAIQVSLLWAGSRGHAVYRRAARRGC